MHGEQIEVPAEITDGRGRTDLPRRELMEGLMDDGLLERIRKVFHLAFGVEPQSIAPDTRPVDVPGWDSLGHLELTTGLEREFSITFDVDELMAMENVRDIIRIVSSRCGPRESM